MFWVLLFCLFFYFYFRARFPAFLFARVNLPIESKVWSRVARTNYMRTKQGYYMSSWTIPVADPGEGPGGPCPPPLFLTKLRPEGPKVFLRLCVLVVSICFTLRSSILSCAHITHTDLYNSVTLNNVNE